MATSTHLEVERSYHLPPGRPLPDLSGTGGVVTVRALPQEDLDATYLDTADLRLARAGTTLRRRSGGRDAGWHLKLPVGGDAREELRRPARGRTTTVPRELSGLVRSLSRGEKLLPVVRLRTTRQVLQLLDADQRVLAELADDAVTGDVLLDPGRTRVWREVEVELVAGDADLLDALEPALTAAGAVRGRSPSKLAHTLGSRLTRREAPVLPKRPSAGDAARQHLAEQAAELLARDPAVRRDLPDSVHKMRVATRRLRSALKTFRPLLDREATDGVRAELTHLAAVLGQARDAEVLLARLRAAVEALPAELVVGPVAERIDDELGRRYRDAHAGVVRALDSARTLALYERLDQLVAEPPLTPSAARPAPKQLRHVVLRTWRQLERSVAAAEAAPTPEQREHLLHEARKTSKQVRYAAEACAPVLGGPARRLAARSEGVQEVLGEFQDSVVAREALRELAGVAHAAGESTFTFGLLHALEAEGGRAAVARFDAAWRKASRREVTAWMR